VVALGTGEGAYRVREVLWEGSSVDAPVLLDAVLQQGGTLRFVMEGEPSPMRPFDPAAAVAAAPRASGAAGTTPVALAAGWGAADVAAAASAAAAAAVEQYKASAAAAAAGGSGAEAAASSALLAHKEAELEALKRAASSLQGSLHEQLDTYSGAADRAQVSGGGGGDDARTANKNHVCTMHAHATLSGYLCKHALENHVCCASPCSSFFEIHTHTHTRAGRGGGVAS
jgi:hypothetical protein